MILARIIFVGNYRGTGTSIWNRFTLTSNDNARDRCRECWALLFFFSHFFSCKINVIGAIDSSIEVDRNEKSRVFRVKRREDVEGGKKMCFQGVTDGAKRVESQEKKILKEFESFKRSRLQTRFRFWKASLWFNQILTGDSQTVIIGKNSLHP